MSLIRKKTRITVERAAEILGLSPKTVYNRGGGTSHLTRIKNGRQVRMILEEVIAHAERQERC